MINHIFAGLLLSVFSFFAMAGLRPVFKEPPGRDLQARNMRLVEDGVLKASHGFLLDEQGDILCQVDIANASKEEQVALVPEFVTPVSASSNPASDVNIPFCNLLEKQAMAALASQSRSSLDNQYAGLFAPVVGVLGGCVFYLMSKDAKDKNIKTEKDVMAVLNIFGGTVSGIAGFANQLPEKGVTLHDMLSKTAWKAFLKGLAVFEAGWLVCAGVHYLMTSE